MKKGEKKEKKRRLDTNILKCKTIWNVTFRAFHENKNNNKTKRVEKFINLSCNCLIGMLNFSYYVIYFKIIS